ncbi:MAG: hypothetical protein ABMA64_29135 [Myxococcota bacterium]
MEVKAPTDTVWIHPDGTLTVGPTPDAASGGWSRTTPSGESELVEGSAQLGDDALEHADEAVPVAPSDARRQLHDPNQTTLVRRPGESAEAYEARMRDLEETLRLQRLDVVDGTPEAAALDAQIDEVLRRRVGERASEGSMGAVDFRDWTGDEVPNEVRIACKGIKKRDVPPRNTPVVNPNTMTADELAQVQARLAPHKDRAGVGAFYDEVTTEITERGRTVASVPLTGEPDDIAAEILAGRLERVMVDSASEADEVYRILDQMALNGDGVARRGAEDLPDLGNGDFETFPDRLANLPGVQRPDLPLRGPERHLSPSDGPSQNHYNVEVILQDRTMLNIHIFFPDPRMPK